MAHGGNLEHIDLEEFRNIQTMYELGVIGNKRSLYLQALQSMLLINQYASATNRTPIKDILGDNLYEFINPPDPNELHLTRMLVGLGFPISNQGGGEDAK